MNEGQELVEAKETAIQPFSEFEAEIVEFEEMNSEMKFDLATEKGVEECEAYLLLLRKVEIRIEKKRKAKGTDLRQAVTDLNDSAKVWHNRVHVMYDVHDEPLAKVRQAILDAAIDAKEKADAEAKAIEDKREAELKAREADMAAKEAAIKEKEDKAAAILRDAKHEKELEDAKLVAAQGAIEKEKVAAHQRENDRVAAELTEKNRLEGIETARKANVEHCKEFNNLALNAIIAITDDPASSLRLVKAIVQGKIPNITMNY